MSLHVAGSEEVYVHNIRHSLLLRVCHKRTMALSIIKCKEALLSVALETTHISSGTFFVLAHGSTVLPNRSSGIDKDSGQSRLLKEHHSINLIHPPHSYQSHQQSYIRYDGASHRLK